MTVKESVEIVVIKSPPESWRIKLGVSSTLVFVHKVDKGPVVSLRRLGRQSCVSGVVQHFLHPCEKSLRSMQRNRFRIISADSCSK